jgi:hypothetical protein
MSRVLRFQRGERWERDAAHCARDFLEKTADVATEPHYMAKGISHVPMHTLVAYLDHLAANLRMLLPSSHIALLGWIDGLWFRVRPSELILELCQFSVNLIRPGRSCVAIRFR